MTELDIMTQLGKVLCEQDEARRDRAAKDLPALASQIRTALFFEETLQLYHVPVDGKPDRIGVYDLFAQQIRWSKETEA